MSTVTVMIIMMMIRIQLSGCDDRLPIRCCPTSLLTSNLPRVRIMMNNLTLMNKMTLVKKMVNKMTEYDGKVRRWWSRWVRRWQRRWWLSPMVTLMTMWRCYCLLPPENWIECPTCGFPLCGQVLLILHCFCHNLELLDCAWTWMLPLFIFLKIFNQVIVDMIRSVLEGKTMPRSVLLLQRQESESTLVDLHHHGINLWENIRWANWYPGWRLPLINIFAEQCVHPFVTSADN